MWYQFNVCSALSPVEVGEGRQDSIWQEEAWYQGNWRRMEIQMRKLYKPPEVGETRIIKKFLWFPEEAPCGERLDQRWLEIATIRQEYLGRWGTEEIWKNVEFIGRHTC